MSDRQGVEIDFCPQCRGVWLDRGELDKIIERSNAAPVAAAQPQAAESYSAPAASALPRDRRREYDDDDDDDSSYRTRDGYTSHGKKKKSFLGDLFDL